MKTQLPKHLVDLIRSKSEYDIKTLDTIDTKNYKTKNYEISNSFANGVNSSNSSSMIPFGEGLSADSESGVSPPNQTPAFEIAYLSASLKHPTTLRRSLNVDFRLSTTPAGQFNKLVFSLTHGSRQREFFSNIEDEHRDEWEYQEAYAKFAMINHKDKWIGKGRPRDKFVKNRVIRSSIKLGTACVLELNQGIYTAHLYIEGIYTEAILSPVPNTQYPFRYDSGPAYQKPQVIARGGWL